MFVLLQQENGDTELTRAATRVRFNYVDVYDVV